LELENLIFRILVYVISDFKLPFFGFQVDKIARFGVDKLARLGAPLSQVG